MVNLLVGPDDAGSAGGSSPVFAGGPQGDVLTGLSPRPPPRTGVGTVVSRTQNASIEANGFPTERRRTLLVRPAETDHTD